MELSCLNEIVYYCDIKKYNVYHSLYEKIKYASMVETTWILFNSDFKSKYSVSIYIVKENIGFVEYS